MPFPDISPIAIQLGPIAVRWYALAYLAGVFAGAWYATTLLRRKDLWANDHPPFEPAAIWDFAFWAVIGIVLGGRIGYVLFYNLPYYSAHPNEIIALWDGGMSFHGGLVGIIAAMWLFTRSKGGNVLSSLDLLGAIGSIGLFLGRLANFVNGELYGAPTRLPRAGVWSPASWSAPRRLGWLHRPGLTGGVFGIGYALSRIVVEFVRLPDAQLGYLLGTGWLTMGQVLSLPVLAAGLALVVYAMSRPRA